MVERSQSRTGFARLFISAVVLIWGVSLTAAAETPKPGRAAGKSEPSHMKVRVSSAELERSVAKEGGTLVARYEGFSIWQVPSAEARSLARKSPSVEVLENENKILLNTGALDTTLAETKALSQSVGSFGGKRLHLVQFAGPIQPGWYRTLVATGVKVIQPIPSNAYLVWGDSNALARVQSMARSSAVVQWDGAYTADYKIQPGTPGRGAMVPSVAPTNLFFQVQLVKDAEANAATLQVVNSLQTSPVKQQYEILSYVNFVVGLPTDAVTTVAARPDVVSIAKWSEPRKLDERQNMIISGQLTGNSPTPGNWLTYLAGKGFTQAQFTASNFLVDISDSGVDNGTATPNHFGLYKLGDPTVPANSRIIYNRLEGTPNGGSTLQGCDGHGNLNTHIVCGYVPDGGIFTAFPHADASLFRYGLGVAPFVKMGSSVIFDPDTFTFPSYANLQSEAYNDGARISTNSWGSNANSYTTDSQAYDALVRDAQPSGSTFPVAGNQEMVIVFAAGNQGSGANTVGSPGTGKNVITVGAAEGVQAFGAADQCGIGDTGADSANDIIAFSSRGPTSDGRRKPELVAPGTHISGGVGQASIASPTGSGTGAQIACFDASGVCAGPGVSNFFPLAQQWYTASDGTSHSTPATAGAAALIRQYFINQSLSPPSPAMTKAVLMNTARYMNGVGANDTLWSNSQGMGEVNLESFFDVFATPRILNDEVPADTFTATGQQRILTGIVSSGAKPFRVTLAWTDVPGPTSGNAFVNNLDLEVTVGGNTYKGNVFTGAFSTPGGSADTRNNAESVILPAGVTGSFVIRVKATNIAGDGVPGDANPLDQDFALVVYNATAAPLPVLQSGATALTAESCAPPNSAIDPTETVTVNFGLSNVGTANTTNLVATLQASGGVTSPSGPQNYGVVVAGGPAVTRPFTFTAGTTCGQTITATLQLQDGPTNLGTVTFTFSTGALGSTITATYSTGNIATAIPDNSFVDIPFVISDSGVVTDVNVKIRLNHTFDGDLDISLISPGGGITVPLTSGRGGSGDNFGTGANDCSGTHTIFDDSAATAISAGSAPFAGTFRPETPLSAFNGALINGTWTLHVADTAVIDTGTVGCAQLEITRQRFVCCGVPGTPQIVSGGAGTITAESFAPPNSAPDPNETVTASFPLINIGDANTVNLVATLQNSGGVSPITISQNYGVVVAAGPAVSRSFTFVANGACGGTITATLHLQDGVLDLGNVTYTFQLGTTSTSTQTFSNAAAITIPASGTGAVTGAPATPYPSNIAVAGVPLSGVTKITVSISNYNHTFPDDVDLLLVSPTGVKMIVLSDAGSSTVATNLNITLDDNAVAALPDGTGIASGTFRPSNYGTVQDPFPAPAPVGPYLTPQTGGTDTLASFLIGSPNLNGTWSLYAVDDANLDSGNINGGWSIAFTTTTFVCSSGPPPPPVIAKAFTAATVPVNGSTALTFTITNPSAGSPQTGISFTDTLPAGLVVATPNGLSATTCVPPGTITATAGSGSISLAGANLAGSALCNFSVNVTGTTAGLKSNNVTVSSTSGGTGNTFNATLTVVAPPTVTKAFGAPTVPAGGTTSLTVTITNPPANTVALTGVGFTDPLPAGLVVATPNGLVNTCGGAVTAVAGSGSVSLAGGTVGIGSFCTVRVNVLVTTPGTFPNVLSSITSANGGSGNPATGAATLSTLVADVPTLGPWALALLGAALAMISVILLRRRS